MSAPPAQPSADRVRTSGGTAFRRHGHGPARVLLLHALTGSPDAADRPGVKGWWSPLFASGAPLAAEACTVWTPNLLGSCYGAAAAAPTVRDQAAAIAAWIATDDLRFDLLLGGSLGGMVALELAVQAADRFRSVGVIGCGGRSDAWVRGQVHAERRVLESALPDREAIALARRFAMLSFRAPKGLDARFAGGDIEAWLDHHGSALAARFTRASYHALLGAMASHDLGRGRGGLVPALQGLRGPLHVLGIDSDSLFSPALIRELAEAARRAGRFGSLRWLRSPHGHDAFLLEWAKVAAWLDYLLAFPPHPEVP